MGVKYETKAAGEDGKGVSSSCIYVQTVPLVGIFFRQHFPICLLIGIPLVGMCHLVAFMYKHAQ